MKQLLGIVALATVLIGVSCAKAPGQTTAPKKALSDEGDEQMSYAFGMIMASDFEDVSLPFNAAALAQGFQDQLAGETTMTFDEALGIVQTSYAEAMEVKSEETRQEGIAYLKENRTKEGITVTESGLQYEVLTQGNGPRPRAEDTVQVHYEGTFIDGTVFDSSYQRGEPQKLPLTNVIPGWSEGLQLMRQGATYRFYIPSELAYGENGAGQRIPPNAVLIFKVELLSINPQPDIIDQPDQPDIIDRTF
ncbi:MAG: FKBP-type peptidyl-prolyl cis-trans isomerase [Spirochaetaceae bacterium]|nr:FKBP-type peptidyl-prolyl cis-trans isomerase [Spirochaetaceae bacterium]